MVGKPINQLVVFLMRWDRSIFEGSFGSMSTEVRISTQGTIDVSLFEVSIKDLFRGVYQF